MSEFLIEISNLEKIYKEGANEHKVLNNLDLQIKKGEILVLLGKSGSGKTTLLNLISGIDSADAGDLLVAGRNFTELNDDDLTLFRRKHLGFIFQFFNLINTLTVKENLFLPLELNQIMDQANQDYALTLLDEVGLSSKVDSYPDTLSGGEQQRIAIARALVHKPDLIIADEPTGNLDLETGRQVLDLLDRLVRKANKTMVMATHSQEVIGLADRVLKVQGGELVDV